MQWAEKEKVMTNALTLEPVPFHGETIMAGRYRDEVLVNLKPSCERFGLDWSTQYRKLATSSEEKGWAVMVKITTTGRDGKMYEQTLETLETFLVC